MIVNLEKISNIIYLLKTIFIAICTYYTFLKIVNIKEKDNTIKSVIVHICIVFISVIATIVKFKTKAFTAVVSLTAMLIFLCSKSKKSNLGNSIIGVIISLGINYIIWLISILISFILNFIIKNYSDINSLILICMGHIIILTMIFKTKKFKNGFSFLQSKRGEDYISITVLNMSISALLINAIIGNGEVVVPRDMLVYFVILTIAMITSIQKSLQLYYKQKLLEQELEKTKEELAAKTKDIENLEKENIEISKKAHTLTHKQKSLAHKIDEMMMNIEISKEEVVEAKERLNEIGKELYNEKVTTELIKTEIPQIDDMLKYMQSECSANKIDFELQVKGNIHQMTNNFISKEDLETLLADHIKNAIIAINHTNNINRSILVKLGAIDETYGLYIYDSGIEFEKETLENLGKKPSTTHKDKGGTGMGFMNTFDTLRKCKASLIIEEFNKPDKDNYTKAIIIKFDNKNKFKIKSYRESEILIHTT